MLSTRLIHLANASEHHAHDHHQLVFSLQGKAAFEVDGQGGEVSASSACLVPSSAEHTFEGLGRNDMLIIDLAKTHPHISDQLFERPLYPQLDPDFLLLLGYVQAELNKPLNHHLLQNAIGYLVIQALHCRLFGAQLLQSMQRLNLERIESYMQQHLSRKIHVAELAQLAHLSVGHFYLCFKQSTGQTPQQFLLQRRLEKALFLLQETMQPISQIAEQCGFSNQSALTRLITRHFSLSPKQLRLRHISH